MNQNETDHFYSPYRLFPNTRPDDPTCQQCGSNADCIYCVYFNPDINWTCVATSTVLYCYSYSDKNTWQECRDLIYQNLVGQKCTPLSPSIIKTCLHAFNSTTVSDVCPNNILSTNGSCNTTDKYSDPNCGACYWNAKAASQFCWLCASPYVLWSNCINGASCFAGGSVLTGFYRETTPNVCLNCHIGYYLGVYGCQVSFALNYNVPIYFSALFSVGMILISAYFFGD